LVDDEADFRAQSGRMLSLVLEERGECAKVAKFESAAELLAACVREPFDLYFLDIIMPGMNGIELAHRLRETQPYAPIVFFTTSRDFALEAYSVRAADYVVKPIEHGEFARAIDHAVRLLALVQPQELALRTDEGYVKVAARNIIDAESGGRYQVVRLLDGRSLVLHQSMEELWALLGDGGSFFRIGRQNIVNLAHMTDFCDRVMTMSGGKRISVPRRSLAEVRQAVLRFFNGR